MIEATSYALVLSLALLFCLRNTLIPNRVVFLFFFLSVGISLSVVIRSVGYDSDIETYDQALRSESLSFYYWREPFFWIGARAVFQITGSSIATFVLFDTAAILMVALGLHILRAPQYAFFAFLLFFPVVLGMQNVYRQWLAESAFLLAFALAICQNRGSYLWSIVALLAHNAAIVFLPLIGLLNKRRLHRYLAIAALVSMPIALFLLRGSKSSTATGIDLAFAFVAVGSIVVTFLVVTNRLTITGLHAERSLAMVGLVTIWTALGLLSSANTERITMFFLVVMFPVLVLQLERRISERPLARALLTTLGFAPILFVEASYMLTTG